jgi:hypothetical protein
MYSNSQVFIVNGGNQSFNDTGSIMSETSVRRFGSILGKNKSSSRLGGKRNSNLNRSGFLNKLG